MGLDELKTTFCHSTFSAKTLEEAKKLDKVRKDIGSVLHEKVTRGNYLNLSIFFLLIFIFNFFLFNFCFFLPQQEIDHSFVGHPWMLSYLGKVFEVNTTPFLNLDIKHPVF